MPRIRYQVACSLDGYIAGPDGEFDWIVEEPEIDFSALQDQFDTLLMGRATYEVMLGTGGDFFGKRVVVFSRTLDPADHPEMTIVADDFEPLLNELLSGNGKDLWLFGGGHLFRTLLERGYVDTVEVAVIPILLGRGIPILPETPRRTALSLTGHRVYPSGISLLEYDVVREPEAPSESSAA